MPETAFSGAQIAPKSLSAGASPQTPLHGGAYSAPPRLPSWIQGALLLRLLLLRGGEGRGGPQKIVHPEKFLRIGPVVGFAPAFCVERGSPPRRVLHGALVRSVRQQCKFYCRMRVRNGRLKTDTGGLQPSSPLKLCIQRWPKTNPPNSWS